MEVNNIKIKDGDVTTTQAAAVTPSVVETSKQNVEGPSKKKRRRGKSKRKIMKPFLKIPWQDRRKNDKTKRNNRFRKIVLAKTHAPYNNNQFLMEIHKPEPENNFHARTPSARTRDSSFSIDSEDNYFFSLPEDEEEYLTKEFSSVYEDAQSERLSNMSKDELIQEYLLLEAKYDNLIKRTERSKPKHIEENDEEAMVDKNASVTDKDSMVTDRDTSGTSIESSATEDTCMDEVMSRVKEQEDQIRELQLSNEKLKLENESLRQQSQVSSSEDSESDSSSTSVSSSTNSSRSVSPIPDHASQMNGHVSNDNHIAEGQNGIINNYQPPLMNGFHDPSEEDAHENI